MHSSPVDDGIYMRIHIYSPLFSCNAGIQVARVFLEMIAPSGHWLKGQETKVKVDKATEKPVQKETTALPHKQNLILNQLEDWKRLMDSQVPE